MKEMKIFSPTAILGYGFPLESFNKGMALHPDVIAVDAGSTDPGPFYLGSGKSFTDRGAVKRDLTHMIKAAIEEDIPVMIGSAGGSGAASHLQWCEEIIIEISKEEKLSFKLAVIPADIDRGMVSKKLADGHVKPLHPAPELTQEDVDKSTNIVAQMGIEPFIEALGKGAQVVLAGRAYDPTAFAAYPIMKGYDPGLALHLGKILECASIAATPGSGSDCMMGYLGEDYFKVEPLNEIRKCTTNSVAAHTLYEKTNPFLLPGPGGHLDLTGTKFEQVTERAVKVSGSKFVPQEVYTVKLEAAKLVGYRTISVAGTRDPIMISQIDNIIDAVKSQVKKNFEGSIDNYHLDFIVYGKNGVMGNLEPVHEVKGHELGIVMEAVAETQDIANTILSFARSTMLHYGYDGRVATAGNLAFPYSPSDFVAGKVYEFTMYHVMEIDSHDELFKPRYIDL
jgi:hypothetical protein